MRKRTKSSKILALILSAAIAFQPNTLALASDANADTEYSAEIPEKEITEQEPDMISENGGSGKVFSAFGLMRGTEGAAAQIGGTTYSTLQEALTAVKDGETITLLKDVQENVSSANQSYTLDMQGHTISAAEGSADYVYVISGGEVTLKNGAITGTETVAGGGLNVNNSAKLTADHLTVTGHHSDRYSVPGGGMCAKGNSVITLTNCIFSGNEAVYGGGIYLQNADLTASNTKICNNCLPSSGGSIATAAAGGLVCDNGRNGTIILNGVNISNNDSSSNGGMYVKCNIFEGSGLTLSNNRGRANKYTAAGGAITVYGKSFLNNSNITGNSSVNEDGIGGLVIDTSENFEVTNCNISGNHGACSAIDWSVRNKVKNIILESCTIQNNTGGSTLDWWFHSSSKDSAEIKFSNCYITENSAQVEKASVINIGRQPRPIDISFSNTVVKSNTGYLCGGMRAESLHSFTAEGGAIYGNFSLDGKTANDLLLGFANNATVLSVFAAKDMEDGETSFADYVWKDITQNKRTFENGITLSDVTGLSLLYLTARTSQIIPVAEVIDSEGNSAGQYESIMEAINEAADGSTVKLISKAQKILENVTAPEGKALTLDMNGRVVCGLDSGKPTVKIPLGTTLSIIGTAGTEQEGSDGYSIQDIENCGTLSIKDLNMKTFVTYGGTVSLSGKCDIIDTMAVYDDDEAAVVTAEEGSEITIDTLEYSNANGAMEIADSYKQIEIIRHKDGSLIISGGTVKEVLYEDGSLTLSKTPEIGKIQLGKDLEIKVESDFMLNKDLPVELDENELKALNSLTDKTIVLAAPAAEDGFGEGQSDNLKQYISITGASSMVVIKEGEGEYQGKIVATKVLPEGIFLDGQRGDDNNTGLSADQPVKTFEEAKELLKEKENFNDIYILGTVAISEDAEWTFSDIPDRAKKSLKRFPSFTGDLVKVQSGKTVTLSDITIDGNYIEEGRKNTNTANGTLVKVTGGATLNINDGAILKNNHCTQGYGGAVSVDNAKISLNGGGISDNYGVYGGAIGLRHAAMSMSGGTIKENTASDDGGGIGIFEDSQLELTGGTISGNTAKLGGGISVGGSTTVTVGNGSGQLIMKGGEISGNTSRAEGGGIYVQSRNKAEISAGDISGNTSKSGRFGGGGIYVNGTRNVDGSNYQYGSLYVTNAEISNNRAGQWGGGIAGCSTSTVKVYRENGAYVYGNTATDGSNQIFVSHNMAQLGAPDYAISAYMPDGTPYNWTDRSGEQQVPDNMLKNNHTSTTIILNNAVAPDVQEPVTITDNTAAMGGGGIGTNGFVQIGTPSVKEITVTKVWEDMENAYNSRPDSVKIWLMRRPEGSQDAYERVAFLDFKKKNNEWPESLSFHDLPDGYEYTVTEEMGEMPEREDDSKYSYISDVTGSVGEDFTVTNKLAAEVPITVKKVITGNPGSTSTFTFELYKVEDKDGVKEEKTLQTLEITGAGSKEFYVSVEIPEDKTEQIYYIKEVKGNGSYEYDNSVYKVTVTVSVEQDENQEKTLTKTVTYVKEGAENEPADTALFTNRYVPDIPEPETVTVSGSKTWEDNENQDGGRPESITVNLLANGTKVKSKVVTEKEDWKWSFTDLAKYAGGAEIVYTITEDPVEGYSSKVDGYNLTNTYTPGETSRTAVKIWDDENDKDGIRPASILVQLLADGKASGEAAELNAANGWTYTWEKLPEKAEGKDIAYTVREISEVPEYTTSYSADTFTITNTHTSTPEEESGSLEIVKTFTGAAISDEQKSMIDFTVTGPDGYSKTIAYDEFINGKYVIRDLPAGEYRVTENNAEAFGYTLEVTGNSAAVKVEKDQTATTEIINDYTEKPKTGSLQVRKVLMRQGQVVQMPTTFQIGLFTDKEGTMPYGSPKIFDMTNGPATVTFDHLPEGTYYVYELDYNGEAITGGSGYAGELGEFGFEAAISVTNSTVELKQGQKDTTPVIIANDYPDLPEGYTGVSIQISGKKTWVDDGNAAKKRPQSLKLTLNDGRKDIELQSTDSEKPYYIRWDKSGGNVWSYTIANVPKLDNNGDLIEYTVMEEQVDGYEAESAEVMGDRDGKGNIVGADFKNTCKKPDKQSPGTNNSTNGSTQTTGSGKSAEAAKTGDSTNYLLYLALLLAAGALGGTAVYGKKRRKADK